MSEWVSAVTVGGRKESGASDAAQEQYAATNSTVYAQCIAVCRAGCLFTVVVVVVVLVLFRCAFVCVDVRWGDGQSPGHDGRRHTTQTEERREQGEKRRKKKERETDRKLTGRHTECDRHKLVSKDSTSAFPFRSVVLFPFLSSRCLGRLPLRSPR